MRDYLTILRGLLAGETVTYQGAGLQVRGATLGRSDLPAVGVQLGALGPQMVRLAGEMSDGALLNWATPQRIADSRRLLEEGATRAGRDPHEVALTMYIRVCVDEDAAAARLAFGGQVLGYAMARPGTPSTAGYRGLFAQMGFDEVLTELEARRERGESMDALVAATPDEMLTAVGYFGPAPGAAAAYARLTPGLDETMVRIITARPGLEPVVATMEALTPARIRAALR
jgi:alkanesulfonate monooxygenase SsuD/methylene tetrahydromethanopterin reductase-like flavin-dependent oxidoreductase (luciferase family)